MGTISRSGQSDVNLIEMPRPLVDARVYSMSIDSLILNYEQFLQTERPLYPWADKFVMGFPLPDWQRGFVWSEHQQKRFITSIWNKGDLGSYMVNGWEMAGTTYNRFSNILQDGQQRLTSLERYLVNQLAVEDLNGTPRYWKELSRQEQRRFGGSTFSKCEIQIWDEKTLREIYDLRNFSGTAHLQSERASTL